jgi:hypothetical protein
MGLAMRLLEGYGREKRCARVKLCRQDGFAHDDLCQRRGLELALPPLALAFGLGMGEPANGALACYELGSRQPLPSLAFGHRHSLSASRVNPLSLRRKLADCCDGEEVVRPAGASVMLRPYTTDFLANNLTAPLTNISGEKTARFDSFPGRRRHFGPRFDQTSLLALDRP